MRLHATARKCGGNFDKAKCYRPVSSFGKESDRECRSLRVSRYRNINDLDVRIGYDVCNHNTQYSVSEQNCQEPRPMHSPRITPGGFVTQTGRHGPVARIASSLVPVWISDVTSENAQECTRCLLYGFVLMRLFRCALRRAHHDFRHPPPPTGWVLRQSSPPDLYTTPFHGHHIHKSFLHDTILMALKCPPDGGSADCTCLSQASPS